MRSDAGRDAGAPRRGRDRRTCLGISLRRILSPWDGEGGTSQPPLTARQPPNPHDFLNNMLIPTRIMSTAKTFVSWSLLSFLTQPVAK